MSTSLSMAEFKKAIVDGLYPNPWSRRENNTFHCRLSDDLNGLYLSIQFGWDRSYPPGFEKLYLVYIGSLGNMVKLPNVKSIDQIRQLISAVAPKVKAFCQDVSDGG